ncbi:hypothetical protein FK216_08570 [Moraxellaceae bacterium AER2_44_116]|nr:hypothetical protein [Moraxellaceae bacterium]TQC97791.1 hypothetical protein FK216_08570 [Moraxellaceae bacterium AER2_44_116]
MNVSFVYVWDFKGRKIPQTIREVAEQAFAFYSQKEEPSHALLSFAKQMQAYADQHLDDEDMQEVFAGLVDELTAENKAALRLELPRNSENLLRMVVEAAEARGLIVYDEDGGMAFLAHGIMLPSFMEKEWAKLIAQQDEEEKQRSPSPNLPRTEKQFEVWAGAIIREGLSKHGFIELDKSSLDESLKNRPEPWERLYQRDVAIGRQYLVIAYCGRYPQFVCRTRFFMKSPVVYQYLAEIQKRFMLGFTGEDVFYADFDYPNGLIDSYDLNLGASESAVSQYIDLLEKKFLPLLDIATDLVGLDRIMNGNIHDKLRNKNIYQPSRLIVASLVKNPNFDMLVTESEKSRAWSYKVLDGKKSELDQMVNYIRTEVKGEV